MDADAPAWWTAPGGTDVLAFVALGVLILIVSVVIWLALFDRYAEQKGAGTPLRTTVPTLLAVALASCLRAFRAENRLHFS